MNMSMSCGSLQRSSNIKAGTLFFINYTSPNVKENMPLISTPSVSMLKPLLHRHFTVLRKRNVGSGSPIMSYQTFLVQIADRAQDETEKLQGGGVTPLFMCRSVSQRKTHSSRRLYFQKGILMCWFLKWPVYKVLIWNLYIFTFLLLLWSMLYVSIMRLEVPDSSSVIGLTDKMRKKVRHPVLSDLSPSAIRLWETTPTTIEAQGSQVWLHVILCTAQDLHPLHWNCCSTNCWQLSPKSSRLMKSLI